MSDLHRFFCTSMSVSVIIKWGGQEYSISSLSEEDTVLDLKQSIKSLTGVLPERQKLLGLKVKGKSIFNSYQRTIGKHKYNNLFCLTSEELKDTSVVSAQ